MGNTIGYSIAKALGGRKVGDGWIARCPAHDDREARWKREGHRVRIAPPEGMDFNDMLLRNTPTIKGRPQ
jgi:hypothetical protein